MTVQEDRNESAVAGDDDDGLDEPVAERCGLWQEPAEPHPSDDEEYNDHETARNDHETAPDDHETTRDDPEGRDNAQEDVAGNVDEDIDEGDGGYSRLDPETTDRCGLW